MKQLDTSAALESRDSLAKNLYARLFDWLVAAINRKISALGVGVHLAVALNPCTEVVLHNDVPHPLSPRPVHGTWLNRYK